MSNKNNGNQNPQSAKVLKLGLNISVSGEPGTDFEIFLDDKEQKAVQLLSQNEDQFQALDTLETKSFTTNVPKHELEKKKIVQEVAHAESSDAISKCQKILKDTGSSELLNMSESVKDENFTSQDTNIISQIKSTMEHFEKFSDHIKEIPRFRNCPAATSTPFSDKYNSRSESNLAYPEFRKKKYSHLYDFNSRKDYSRSSVKSFSSDLFLKPLPGEGYYKRGIYTRYFDFEPHRHYGSENSLNKTSEYKSVCLKSNYDVERYDGCNVPLEPLPGILKKSDSESGDKQSTSSADSIKDIKIYQSGGILIMQNFKDSIDVTEKKEISEFSAKLIENCNKLKMDVKSFQEDKPAIGNSSDENKNSGKMVQFDLSNFEDQKSKEDNTSSNAFKDESSGRMESSESTSDCMKNKDSSTQGTSQSQDFPSLSTQENDSILSNQPGTSPIHASSRKLEWDSGADVGYLNLDLKKENLSTIEKIVLKGLSSDGQSEKNVVYEMKPEQDQSGKSKFVLERKSDLIVEKNTKPKKGKDSDTSDSKKKEKQHANRENGKSSKIFEEENKYCERITSRELTKDELAAEFEEAKPISSRNSAKGISVTKVNEVEYGKKFLELSDKSVNVNTLFDNGDWTASLGQSAPEEFSKPSESSTKHKFKKSSKISLSKNKKLSPQKLLKASKKVCAGSVNARLLSGALEMGVPKKIYKKLEASPALNDVELSREVEEIIIDQRFKIKQNIPVERETTKEPEISVRSKLDHFKEFKVKNRPISASSSSNKTVLPKSENREHVKEKAKKNFEHSKFTDRIIQTNSYDCESVGVQAFASQISSDGNFITSGESEIPKPVEKGNRDNVNTSSKNIQAFGLNASLPKQLEHPRETEVVDNQHTKSTQFFGGPLNSLPNYHSNLVTKPKETCGRVPNILKTKKNSEAEIIRLKEENEKNILANDAQPKLTELERDLGKHSDNENKENFIDQKSINSKKSHNERPRINSKENASQDSDKRKSERKKKLLSVEGSDCPRLSDEVSSMVLTSEVLKVHCDSIDRNIIQEKYFQSQLVELEKRKMISRSTSMEMQLQLKSEEIGKEFITIGCQYSPQSRRTTSEGHYEEFDDDSFKDNIKAQNRRRKELKQYYSGQNMADDHFETSKSFNQEQELGAGDSLPSSTQTAHSWIAGGQSSYENTKGVGRARSFEYLPGHIYESSGNLGNLKLPSEAEQNLTTSSSDSDTAKGSISNGQTKDSEGRNTLILENSTDLSHDSDRLKILDENLAQLNFAVMKLWEKDAQVQSVTQSLLAKLWKKNGSGDFLALEEIARKECNFQVLRPLVVKLLMKRNRDLFNNYLKDRGEADSSKTEVIETRDLSSSSGKKRKDIFSEMSVREPVKDGREREFSIACQTEEKSPSEPEKFYEERKVLEKRISEEKKSQIKWIENEIHHLNILRELLEKRNSPIQKKKKLSPLTINSDDSSKSEENYSKYTSKEIIPRITTPVYGCTISFTENAPTEKEQPVPEKSSCTPKEKEPCSAHYGMAVSLSGCPKNWKPLVMLPLDLQVSLKNSDLLKECIKDLEKENDLQSQQPTSSKSSKSNSLMVQQRPTHSDINTQYPSAKRDFRNIPSTSVQTDFPSPEGSNRCTKENCFCINLSENSCLSVSRSSRSKTSEKRDSLKLRFSNEDSVTDVGSKTSHSTDPELAEMQSNPMSQSEKKNKNITDLSGICAKHKLVQSTNRKYQRSNDKADSSGRCIKQLSVQSTICKCQNCSKRLPSPSGKPEVISRGSCQPNIYVDCEKLSEDVRSCRCSKIQVQKSLNCACHIIKIHGSKCCSPERSSCFCTRQNFIKKTENQSCQTDCDSLEKPLEIKNPDESKITIEKRMSILEKLSCDPKIAYKKVHPTSAKLELKEKNALESRIPETEVPVKTKLNCSCRKKAEKEKAKDEDQPRHYFLRVVETEVDDSNEMIEQKKSLEVITVTVPVKKIGKGKISSSNVRQTWSGNQAPSKPFVDIPSRSCNCCAECQQNCRVPTQNYESRFDYRRNPAEKPESPTGNSKISKICSSESTNFYGGVNYPNKDLSREFSSPPENCQDGNGYKFRQPDSSYSQKFINDSYEPQCCEDCNCLRQNTTPSKEIQGEYNSHKKRRDSNARECYNDKSARFYEGRQRERTSQNARPRFDTGPCADDWSSGSKHSRPQDVNVESDRCNSDYYNYNKREYMTKSEILKEEQKRKVHQPSLQECLSSNRPDFYNSAEKRRQIISERAKERVERRNNRMECLLKMMQRCSENEQSSAGTKRIFTTVQMREQTMRKYKKLPEVVGKVADQKKKEEYRTNRLMADVFAKKLQIEALKGHINLSNSVSVLYTL